MLQCFLIFLTKLIYNYGTSVSPSVHIFLVYVLYAHMYAYAIQQRCPVHRDMDRYSTTHDCII